MSFNGKGNFMEYPNHNYWGFMRPLQGQLYPYLSLFYKYSIPSGLVIEFYKLNKAQKK